MIEWFMRYFFTCMFLFAHIYAMSKLDINKQLLAIHFCTTVENIVECNFEGTKLEVEQLYKKYTTNIYDTDLMKKIDVLRLLQKECSSYSDDTSFEKNLAITSVLIDFQTACASIRAEWNIFNDTAKSIISSSTEMKKNANIKTSTDGKKYRDDCIFEGITMLVQNGKYTKYSRYTTQYNTWFTNIRAIVSEAKQYC